MFGGGEHTERSRPRIGFRRWATILFAAGLLLGTPSAAVTAARANSPTPSVSADAVSVVELAPAPAAASGVPSDGKLHLVDIGGRRIAIWCEGRGGPTVVLEHGVGYVVDSGSWVKVQAGVAKETRVCRYDRAFVGESDDAKPGRSMPDIAEDLVDLMHAARIPGPYVIVGHSFGGLTVRYFTFLHPKSILGMVLVDPSPTGIGDLDLSSERLDHDKVIDQLQRLQRLGNLGDMPLVIITRGIDLPLPWARAQAAMVKLSSRGYQVIARNSDHWIQLRQPDLVVREILRVLHASRIRER